MKNKKILITLAALSTLGVMSASTFAFGGYGHGQGAGQGRWQGQGFGRTLTDEQRSQLQSMSVEERQTYMQNLRSSQGLPTQQNSTAMQTAGQFQWQGRGQGRWMGQRQNAWQNMGQGQQRMQEDPSQIIANYPVSNLTDEEKEGLYNQYGEEKMARDVYLYAYEKYWVATFQNIANSEQQHMNAIKALLDRYGITPPTDYAKDTELAEQLKSQVDQGLEQALNVGVTIEEVDIKDIAELTKEAAENNAQDVLAVYANIAGGSYNHLRGFLQALQNYGYTLPDVSEYLPSSITVDQLLQMRGPDAKELFVDYVQEHYGIDLSNYQQQCQQNQATSTTATTIPTTTTDTTVVTEPTTDIDVDTNVDNYIDTSKLGTFKTYIEDKYADKINNLSTDQISSIIDKINTLEDQISNSTTYSETTKQTYITVLEALKQVLQDKLNSADGTDIIGSLLWE